MTHNEIDKLEAGRELDALDNRVECVYYYAYAQTTDCQVYSLRGTCQTRGKALFSGMLR